MLKFYNTLTHKKNVFKPLESKTVKLYSCGPTVYNYAHIGNLSAYLFADLLKRYLRYSDYKVFDVMNLTDVDDKTIKASRKSEEPLSEYTSFFIESLLIDFELLNIVKPKVLCRATKHIKEMINLIQRLIDKGYAYQSDDGSIYYKVSLFKDYGKFARLNREELKAGASKRVDNDEYSKEEVADFVLWKAWTEKDGNVFWDSPFGKGRPGWHIECSAMSMKYLGETFDIHTGAVDLIFPHHQNEIAQSEAATGKKFVRYWLHRGFLKVDGKKMSKSLGNVFVLKDIMKEVADPLAFRYLVLTSHYRTGLNFTFNSLEASLNALNRLRDFIGRLSEINNSKNDSRKNLQEINVCIRKSSNNFKKHMDDDLDTPRAIAVIFHFIGKINKMIDEDRIGIKGSELIMRFIKDIDQVWGFLEIKEKRINKELEDKIEKLVKKRDQCRSNKEWGKADKIRKELSKIGVVIKDNRNSTTWEFKNH